MQSERTARLADALAVMPDGPSRERFLDVLAELEAADERADADPDAVADADAEVEVEAEVEAVRADEGSEAAAGLVGVEVVYESPALVEAAGQQEEQDDGAYGTDDDAEWAADAELLPGMAPEVDAAEFVAAPPMPSAPPNATQTGEPETDKPKRRWRRKG